MRRLVTKLVMPVIDCIVWPKYHLKVTCCNVYKDVMGIADVFNATYHGIMNIQIYLTFTLLRIELLLRRFVLNNMHSNLTYLYLFVNVNSVNQLFKHNINIMTFYKLFCLWLFLNDIWAHIAILWKTVIFFYKIVTNHTLNIINK